MNEDIQTETDLRGPGVQFPPPLIAFLVFGVSYAIGHYFPQSSTGGIIAFTYLGYMLMALSLYIAVDGTVRLNRAKTNVKPNQPTTSIVETGVYRFTRNPLYLSLGILQLGLGLVLDRLTIVIGSIVFFIVVRQVAVLKEEAYLEKKFGESYLAYRERVRRWI
ncbi:MAG: isoprenylcysteine carboxylmethyltransferase family protein [Verrucomicrobiales bacterium]|nr:isoprenylcysteine carboxylmethyltransferase family protein [Verrucomicrobiales bacterium]